MSVSLSVCVSVSPCASVCLQPGSGRRESKDDGKEGKEKRSRLPGESWRDSNVGEKKARKKIRTINEKTKIQRSKSSGITKGEKKLKMKSQQIQTNMKKIRRAFD